MVVNKRFCVSFCKRMSFKMTSSTGIVSYVIYILCVYVSNFGCGLNTAHGKTRAKN